MCSKNQEVDPLFAQFITKDFLIQRIFRVLRNSLFRTNDLYRNPYTLSKSKKSPLCTLGSCNSLKNEYGKKSDSKKFFPYHKQYLQFHKIMYDWNCISCEEQYIFQ